MNNIVIICDDKAVSDTLKSNLMFLREFDNVISCDFITAQVTISQNKPQLIILYSKNVDEEILEFIKVNQSTPIFFVTQELSAEIMLNVYDAGATDFISTTQSSTEFLVRVMSCMKRNIEIKEGKRNTELLTQIGILNKNSTFYSVKYTPAVFKNLIKKYCQDNVTLALLAISPDVDDKNKCSLDYLASVLKKNLREDDVIGYAENNLYVLLPNTNSQGALNVYNKVKIILNSTCGLSAGIVFVDKITDTQLLLNILDEALIDALEMKNTAVVQENLTDNIEMNWLDKPKKHKSFKLFKKALMKKLETVIIPVFYQKQQLAEQRLFQVKVEQSCNDKKSLFVLSKNDNKAVLEITYPGLVKINIDIYTNYNDETVRESFELKDLSSKNLSDLLDAFILDFQKQDK